MKINLTINGRTVQREARPCPQCLALLPNTITIASHHHNQPPVHCTASKHLHHPTPSRALHHHNQGSP